MIAYIHALDSNILYAIQSLGPSWYNTAWLLSSVIGSTVLLAPILIGTLFLMGKRRTAAELLFIFIVSGACLAALKGIIHAPRPFMIDPAVIPYDMETNSGMPSGHAFLSLILLGWVWFRHPTSLIVSLGAGVLIFFIGLSRIFLGVHYPSQVIVGWILGFVLLWIFVWLDKIYFRPRSSYIGKKKQAK